MSDTDRQVDFADLTPADLDGVNSVWIAGPDGIAVRKLVHRAPKAYDTVAPARGATELPEEPRLVVIVMDTEAEGIEDEIAAKAYVDSLDFF